MGFVDHDHAVSTQQWINHRLTKQHTICHVLDSRSLTRLVFKSNQVTNLISPISLCPIIKEYCCVFTSPPSLQFFSSATRSATDVAAIRLGCVHATCFPFAVQPASSKYCGISIYRE